MQKYNSKGKIILFSFLIVIFNFSFLIFNLQPARAQAVDLGVWPPILQIMMQPGKGITQVYKVTNFGDPVIISSSVVPFMPDDEQGNVKLVDCKMVEVIGCESLSWFSFQNANLELGQAFFLGSDRTQEAVLKVAIPEYAAEGDYYNTVLFTTQAPPALGEKRSRATATIGSNILITVSKDGNPTREIKIANFSAKKLFSFPLNAFRLTLPIFDSFEPIPVTLRVQNTGNAYTSVSGKITLSGFPGLKSNFSLIPQNILAGSTRLLSATPSAELTNPRSTIHNPPSISLLLPQAFYLGRYTLTATVENKDYNLAKTATISFYAFPIKITLNILGIITITTFIFIILKKFIKNKKK